MGLLFHRSIVNIIDIEWKLYKEQYVEVNFLYFFHCAFSAFSNFVENQHSIIEHYFTNPAGKAIFLLRS